MQLSYISQLSENPFYQKYLNDEKLSEIGLDKYYQILQPACRSQKEFILNNSEPLFLCEQVSDSAILLNPKFLEIKKRILDIKFSSDYVEFWTNFLSNTSEAIVRSWFASTLESKYDSQTTLFDESFFETVKVNQSNGLYIPYYFDQSFKDELVIFKNNFVNAITVSVYNNLDAVFVDGQTKTLDIFQYLLSVGSDQVQDEKNQLFIDLNWNYDGFSNEFKNDLATIRIFKENYYDLFNVLFKYSLLKDAITFKSDETANLRTLSTLVQRTKVIETINFFEHGTFLLEQTFFTPGLVESNIEQMSNVTDRSYLSTLPDFKIGLVKIDNDYGIAYSGMYNNNFYHLFWIYGIIAIGLFSLMFFVQSRVLNKYIRVSSMEKFFDYYYKGGEFNLWKRF